jgi:hypothetical protein
MDATDQIAPPALSADDSHVYWCQGEGHGEVLRIAVNGGSATPFADECLSRVGLDEGYAYWLDFDDNTRKIDVHRKDK